MTIKELKIVYTKILYETMKQEEPKLMSALLGLEDLVSPEDYSVDKFKEDLDNIVDYEGLSLEIFTNTVGLLDEDEQEKFMKAFIYLHQISEKHGDAWVEKESQLKLSKYEENATKIMNLLDNVIPKSEE